MLKHLQDGKSLDEYVFWMVFGVIYNVFRPIVMYVVGYEFPRMGNMVMYFGCYLSNMSGFVIKLNAYDKYVDEAASTLKQFTVHFYYLLF